MIGPIILVVAGGAVGGATGGGWAGAVAGALVGLLVTMGVAGAAAGWAAQVGRALDGATAWEVAPRPPGFRPLCEAVYRRVLAGPDGPQAPEDP